MRTLLMVSRPVSWINTAFPFGAAYLLAGGTLTWDFWVGCVFFLIPYNLLMYGVNDVFDYASDITNPRKGGVEGALANPTHHRRILVASIGLAAPFVLYFLGRSLLVGMTGQWWALVVLVVSIFAVVAYSVPGLRFKEVPVLDSVTSSVHFSSPAWFALALVAARPTFDAWMVLIAFFLWGCASHAFGAVQDIVPDRQGGVASIATVWGAKVTIWTAVTLYAVADLLVLLTRWPIYLGAALVLPYLMNTGRFHRLTDATSDRANEGWKLFIPMNYVVGFCVTVLMIWVWWEGR